MRIVLILLLAWAASVGHVQAMAHQSGNAPMLAATPAHTQPCCMGAEASHAPACAPFALPSDSDVQAPGKRLTAFDFPALRTDAAGRSVPPPTGPPRMM